jgi:hypothetical protein
MCFFGGGQVTSHFAEKMRDLKGEFAEKIANWSGFFAEN